jgi:uncharacterized protein (TIGR02145 family)
MPKSTPLIGDISGNISIYAHWAENPPSLVDSRDGKAYKEVAIGGQIWMAEDLRYNAPGSQCLDDEEANCEKFGRLYSWDEAMTACPAGWRIPSDDDWNDLLDFIGGIGVAGVKLRSTTGWDRYNGRDEFGFTALPPGGWWSATTFDDGTISSLELNVQSFAYFHRNGSGRMMAVRCLKD